MGGAAGIWKKIKTFANTIGNGLSRGLAWANTNLIQPLKPILSNVIDMFDPSGLGSKIFGTATDSYDRYLDFAGEKPDDSFTNVTNTAKDLFEYTQNSDRYNSRPQGNTFKKAFDPNQEINGW